MKTYDCSWCSMETNREEKEALILEDGEMLCPECVKDGEIQKYFKPAELKREEIKFNYPVISLQNFEDVLDALRLNEDVTCNVGIRGNYRLMRLFIHMSECVTNSRGANYK